jgi:hypothetical protein
MYFLSLHKCPSQPPWFCHANFIWWRKYIIKILTIQLSTGSCPESVSICFLPLGSETVSEGTQTMLESYEGAAVLTAAVMKNLIFWRKTPCKPPKLNRRFWGTQTLLESYDGAAVLTAAVMKNLIFWRKTPCKPLKLNRRFGGTCDLHLVSQKRLSTFNGFHAVICQKFGLLQNYSLSHWCLIVTWTQDISKASWTHYSFVMFYMERCWSIRVLNH